jgi:hypothetical protein
MTPKAYQYRSRLVARDAAKIAAALDNLRLGACNLQKRAESAMANRAAEIIGEAARQMGQTLGVLDIAIEEARRWR